MAIINVSELAEKIQSLGVKRVEESSSLLSRFSVIGGSQISFELDNYWLKEGREPEEISVDVKGFEDLANECDLVIASDLLKRAEDYIKEKFYVYYGFYQRCLIKADEDCETAYIMYNEIIGDYEIHYSKRFILEKAITDASLWGSEVIESMIKSVAFVFMHEMNHALRYHMNNQNSLVNGINHEIINIMGDSFINTELQKAIGIPILYNCIDSTVRFKGILKETVSTKSLSRDLQKWYKEVGGLRASLLEPGSVSIYKGTEVTICVTFTSQGLERLFAENSNLYIVETTKFLSRYLETKSASSGSGKGSEDSGRSNGGSEESGEATGGGEGSKDNESASSGSGSDLSDREKADSTLDTGDAKQRAKSNLEEAIQQSSSSGGSGGQGRGQGSGGTGGGSDSLLKSIGADKLARNFSSVQSWKGKLSKLLRDCLGTTERYNSELANARIEGQYGREEDINIPKRMIMAIDCSGSMGPAKFKQVLNEVENFVLVNKFKKLEIIVVFWGSNAVAEKFKMSKGLVQKIIESSKSLGGTNLYECINLIRDKYRKFDLCMVFTDGEIEVSPKEDAKAFVRRVSNRIIWVLTSDGTSNYIAKYDSGCRRRIIQAK